MAKENVKVKLIDTRYVETDAGSFKSVVQRLTGKDSCVGWIEENSFGSGDGAREHVKVVGEGGAGGGAVAFRSLSSRVGLPFRDFDVQPVEELKWLWADVLIS